MKAVIDLDDCLADMRNPLMGFLNDYTGKDLHWSEWHTLLAETLYGITSQEFFDLSMHHKLIEVLQPHPETREFLEGLVERGIEIHIVTARGWHHDGYGVTERWFKEHGLPYTQIHVVNLSQQKCDYIRDMENVLFTVDDSSTHCNGYAAMENGPENVFVYSFPWNAGKTAEKVKRIDSLTGIFEHI